MLAVAGTVLMASPASAAALTATTEAQLASAITTANLDTAPDVITLGGNITLTANLPAITENLEIVGAGFTIDGGSFLAFSDAGAVANIDLTLTNVIITNASSALNTGASNVTITGSDFDNAPVVVDGAGIIVNVVSSHFDNATSDHGFASDIDASSSETISDSGADGNDEDGFSLVLQGVSTLVMTNVSAGNNSSGISVDADGGSNVTVTGSHANDNGDEGFDTDAYGGSKIAISTSTASGNVDDGFDVDISDADSAVTCDQCTSTGNHSSGFDVNVKNGSYAGTHLTATGNTVTGFDTKAEAGSTISVTDSVFSDTVNGYGVAVASELAGSTVSLLRVTANGSDSYAGGGFHIEDFIDGNPLGLATVSIVDSTSSSNQGSGIDVETTGTTILVERSTVSGNDQEGGGGIYASLNGSSSLELRNSTVSGNTCGGGCGLYVETDDGDGATLTIANSTIVNNKGIYDGESAGVEIVGTPYVIRNSIVAGNTINGTPIDFLLPGDGAASGSVDFSLIQKSEGAALTAVDAGTGNLKNMSALLGPLANNGGTTLTHLPQDNSPVVGAGDPAFAGLTIDQRGANRIVNRLDMGAVELKPALAATGPDSVIPLAAGALLVLALGGLLVGARRRWSTR